MGSFSFATVVVGLMGRGESEVAWHAFCAGSVRLLAGSGAIPQYRLVELFRWVLAISVDG